MQVAREALIKAQAELSAAEVSVSSLEEEGVEIDENIAALEERSRSMLRREMLALGVLDPMPEGSSVAFAEPGFVFQGAPVTDSVDWLAVFGETPPLPEGHPA